MSEPLLPDCHDAEGHRWSQPTPAEKVILAAESDVKLRRKMVSDLRTSCLNCGLETSRAAFTIDHIMRWPADDDSQPGGTTP